MRGRLGVRKGAHKRREANHTQENHRGHDEKDHDRWGIEG